MKPSLKFHTIITGAGLEGVGTQYEPRSHMMSPQGWVNMKIFLQVSGAIPKNKVISLKMSTVNL